VYSVEALVVGRMPRIFWWQHYLENTKVIWTTSKIFQGQHTLQHTLPHTATCTATHCNTLFKSSTRYLDNTTDLLTATHTATHTATYCNMHCNTLQQTLKEQHSLFGQYRRSFDGNTHGNTHCNKHYNTHCNIHCNTLQHTINEERSLLEECIRSLMATHTATHSATHCIYVTWLIHMCDMTHFSKYSFRISLHYFCTTKNMVVKIHNSINFSSSSPNQSRIHGSLHMQKQKRRRCTPCRSG
jgi:hypothetical protein